MADDLTGWYLENTAPSDKPLRTKIAGSDKEKNCILLIREGGRREWVECSGNRMTSTRPSVRTPTHWKYQEPRADVIRADVISVTDWAIDPRMGVSEDRDLVGKDGDKFRIGQEWRIIGRDTGDVAWGKRVYDSIEEATVAADFEGRRRQAVNSRPEGMSWKKAEIAFLKAESKRTSEVQYQAFNLGSKMKQPTDEEARRQVSRANGPKYT